MGAVKKVFKSIGSIFGIGGSNMPNVQQVAVDPGITNVSSTDVSGDTGTDAKKKRRRGFASTSTSLMSDAASDGKSTLG